MLCDRRIMLCHLLTSQWKRPSLQLQLVSELPQQGRQINVLLQVKGSSAVFVRKSLRH